MQKGLVQNSPRHQRIATFAVVHHTTILDRARNFACPAGERFSAVPTTAWH